MGCRPFDLLSFMCLVGSSAFHAEPVAESPFVAMSFEQACSEAAEQKKLVLVYFTDPRNAQCEHYRDSTWSDGDLRVWLVNKTIAIQVDASKHSRLRVRLRALRIPAVLVLSPAGRERGRVEGVRAAADLLSELEAGLASTDTVALAKRRLERRRSDPAARLAYARALEEAGQYDKALAQYLQCFDAPTGPGGRYGGAQLVVTTELGRLASDHPPARRALVQRRDASRERILTGTAVPTDPALLAAANTQLGEIDDTLAVYDQLQQADSNDLTTRLLRECLVDSLLEARRYAQIAELIDIAVHARSAYERYVADSHKPVPGLNKEKFRAFKQRSFVERAVKYYEMLIGLQRGPEVAVLATTVLDVDSSAATYHALAQAALRTERPIPANVEQARRAVALSNPTKSKFVVTLVKTLIQLGRHDDALTVIEEQATRLSKPEDRSTLKQLLESIPDK